MKEEIKEILQLIGSCCYYGKISKDKCKKYCDYITNLQEENKAIKERCEYLQRSCDRKEEQRDDARREYMEQDDYKSRNEKAIEYVHGMWLAKLTPDTVTNTKFELLNILQGENK